MCFLLVFSFLLLACLGSITSLPLEDPSSQTGFETKRIINGKSAEVGEFPYVMRLKKLGQTLCTACLISKQTALTAAHCVVSKFNGVQFSVYEIMGTLGSVDEKSKGYVVLFKEFRVHEKYDRKTSENDIAALIMSEPVLLNENINTVALPGKGLNLPVQTSVSISGWGWDSFEGIKNGGLHYMKVNFFPREVCIHFFKSFNPDKELCVSQQINSCIYEGDSGSPLTQKRREKKDLLVGIASFRSSKKECNLSPATFTSVSSYHDWIKQHSDGQLVFE